MKVQYPPIQVIKGFIFLLPFFVLFWLGVQYFSLFGELSIEYDFKGESPFISELRPHGRVLDREKNLRTGEAYQKIVGEPAYIDVTVPRSFNTVDVIVEYTNLDQPFVEFGLVKNTEPWTVQLLPFEGKVIDEALGIWERIEDNNGLVLLQQEKQFDSIQSFIAGFPTDQGIGTYGYDLLTEFYDEAYAPQDGTLVVDRLLRGPHHFLAYAKEETVHVEFDFKDINYEFNDDPVAVEVYHQDSLILEETVQSDNISIASGALSDLGTLIIDIPNAEEGLYQFKVNVNNDIVISQIRSEQHQFIVNKNLFIINNEEYSKTFADINTEPTTLYFKGDSLSAKSDHPLGIQAIQIAEDTVNIDTVHRPFDWSNIVAEAEQHVLPLTLPLNDVNLIAKGFYSFTEESFFDPDYLVQTIDAETKIDDLDFILYNGYIPPVEERRFNTQYVHFDLDGVAGDRKFLTFIVSAPGIDRNAYSMAFDRIQFDFHREPLYTRVLQRLKN